MSQAEGSEQGHGSSSLELSFHQQARKQQHKSKRPLIDASTSSLFQESKRSKIEYENVKVRVIPMIDGWKSTSSEEKGKLKGNEDENGRSIPKDAPMLIKNQVPGLSDITDENERFKRDVSLRPQDLRIDGDAYKRVPIEQYGAAMLRGMGWDPKKGVGAKGQEKVIKPTLFETRPSLLGLGAMPKPELMDGKAKKRRTKRNYVHPPWLCVNALVKMKGGRYQGEYGVVYQLDNIPDREGGVVIQLDPGDTSNSVSDLPRVIVDDTDLVLVDPEKLSKNHHARALLRRAQKEKQKLLMSGSSSYKAENKGKQRKKGKKEKKKLSERKVDSWVVPGIRVRIVSKKVGKGAYYTKKGVITCVTDPANAKCEVEVNNPRAILENINQRDLETALPKQNGRVLIVRGEFRGKEGTLLERNSKKDKVRVQLQDNLSIVKLRFDDVAEYVYTDM